MNNCFELAANTNSGISQLHQLSLDISWMAMSCLDPLRFCYRVILLVLGRAISWLAITASTSLLASALLTQLCYGQTMLYV